MEVDYIEEPQQGSGSQSSKKPIIVPVDEAHPFDLESYISNYTGRTAIDRLIHIVSTCPALAPEAFKLALQYIHDSRDPSLYQVLLSSYEQLSSIAEVQLPDPDEIGRLDTNWADMMIAKNQSERVKLEVELKTYSNNMIRESIRMTHRDLGDFYRRIGDYPTSLKHFTKSREFCTTSQHVLDMCLSVLELLIEQRNYAHLMSYVFKAEIALDAVASTPNPNAAPGSGGTPAAPAASAGSKKKSAERDHIKSKLDLATALSHLGQCNYEKAAYHFLKIGPTKDLGDWVGKLIAPGDIAIYGTLCALSSLPRSAIKAQVVDQPTFGLYMEQEPYIRELVDAYMSSNFKTVLELLSRYSTRNYLDIHMYSHVHDISDLIQNWAVVLYFQPFTSIRLERMGAAFGWTVEEVEQHVVSLIQSGDIHGRVDSQNKILQAKQTDYRAELFARAIKVGSNIQATNRKLLLRMRLQQADLVIKPPKGGHHHLQDYMGMEA